MSYRLREGNTKRVLWVVTIWWVLGLASEAQSNIASNGQGRSSEPTCVAKKLQAEGAVQVFALSSKCVEPSALPLSLSVLGSDDGCRVQRLFSRVGIYFLFAFIFTTVSFCDFGGGGQVSLQTDYRASIQ